MLLLQKRMVATERLESADLPRRRQAYHGHALPTQQAVPRLLPPPRQHERMNVERGGDRLHLHPTLPAEAHRSQLKLGTVFLDLLRTGARHKTPPVVRWKCLQK